MWQQVTTNDNEWQWMTTSDEWYNEWQQVAQQVTASDNEWERVIPNDNEWQQVVQQMKTAQYTSKNGWLPSFL